MVGSEHNVWLTCQSDDQVETSCVHLTQPDLPVKHPSVSIHPAAQCRRRYDDFYNMIARKCSCDLTSCQAEGGKESDSDSQSPLVL